MFDLNVEMDRTASALERIADALERLSPPLAAVPEPPSRPATLSDLHRTDPDSLAPLIEALEDAAQARTGSRDLRSNLPEFVSSMVQFEREVRAVAGDDALDNLPWNRMAGRRVFASYHKSRESADAEASSRP